MSTVVGPDEVAEVGKGQVMSHFLKGVMLRAMGIHKDFMENNYPFFILECLL